MSDESLTEATGAAAQTKRRQPEKMKLAQFLRCVMRGGHDYVNSKARPGHLTCLRCRYRRRNWR